MPFLKFGAQNRDLEPNGAFPTAPPFTTPPGDGPGRAAGSKTKLIVNGVAIERTSLGARRYYTGVMENLGWTGPVTVDRPARSRHLVRVSELLRLGRADSIYWSPSHRGPLWAYNHVVTVLDCINIEYIYRDDWRLPVIRRLIGQLLKNAVAVATISHATRNAVLRNFDIDPSKVQAIPGPVMFDDVPTEHSREPGGSSSGRPFALMITNALPHKNTVRAAQGFAASHAHRAGMMLRVVGNLADEAVEACQRAGVILEQRKGVDDGELNLWLSECSVLISSSLDEGLNLPIAEALARGAEVACSDIAVHREFYDGAVHFFCPTDVASIATAIDRAVDGGLRLNDTWQARRHRSFADVASDYRQLFERVSITLRR